jgi:hypothetical protein
MTRSARLPGATLFDIHEFFLRGYEYDARVIRERTKLGLANTYKNDLLYRAKVTQQVIDEILIFSSPKRFRPSVKRSYRKRSCFFVPSKATSFLDLPVVV